LYRCHCTQTVCAREVSIRRWNWLDLLSQRLHLPIENQIVQRQLHTQPQSELSGDTRRRNMRRAFQLKTPARYRHVALIDDVVTTGSTVNELAQVLRESGVEIIQVWAIARA